MVIEPVIEDGEITVVDLVDEIVEDDIAMNEVVTQALMYPQPPEVKVDFLSC
jgi:hypothetical protein